MSVLEQARQVYARLKAQRNGHVEAAQLQSPGCDISDQNPSYGHVERPCHPSPTRDQSDESDQSPSSGPAPAGEGSVPYRLIIRAADLVEVCSAVEDSALVGLDTETTGLDPRADRVRLLSLAVTTLEGGTFTYLLDLFSLEGADLPPLWDALSGAELVAHNAAFDLRFLGRLGFTARGRLHDVMILSRLLTAGSRNGNALADLTERFLGFRLAKDEQKSDWGVPALDSGQLNYAAADVAHLAALYRHLMREIQAADLTGTAEIEERCLPAWVWLAAAGMPLDREAWRALAARSCAEQARLWDVLEALAPQRPENLPGLSRWNFNSNQDVLAVLKLLGFEANNTRDETLAGIEHPFADALRAYRRAKWLDGTYGESFLRWVRDDGRVYGGWEQTGNEAGRSSCKQPNLQGIPRLEGYRRAFVAPPGRVLVKADFAAAHLRIACRIAGEATMLDAFRSGRDLHRLTAQALLGKADVTKQDRQLAKAVAFGLLYGMGAPGLRDYALQSYGVSITLEEAARHRRTFFRTYPGLAKWHADTRAASATQKETRSLGGRRRLLDPKTPLMHRLNSPVLGTEGDAAKTALALLWERRDRCPRARPVAFVHDEIVLEADAGQAEQAAAWVRQAMADALEPLIAPVPVEVEVRAGRTWAGD
jgi:DNA polymerase-1